MSCKNNFSLSHSHWARNEALDFFRRVLLLAMTRVSLIVKKSVENLRAIFGIEICMTVDVAP